MLIHKYTYYNKSNLSINNVSIINIVIIIIIIVHTTSNYILLIVGMYTTFHIVTLHILSFIAIINTNS